MPDLLLASAAAPARPPTIAVDISICIANWNCRELLRGCLNSLFHQQQGAAFEVIVADNGSTDGAMEMVTREFPQVRLIRNTTNRGFSAASNQAASVAHGEILFFLNNDTVVPPHSLRKLHQFFDCNPAAGLVGPRLVDRKGRNQISYRRRPTLRALLHRISFLRATGLFRRAYFDYRRSDYSPRGVQRVEILMGAAVALRRETFFRYRWDEQFRFGVEDIDLSTQIGKDQSVIFLGDLPIVHFGREASRGNIRFAAPNVAVGYARYFRKAGASRFALNTYKLLVTLDAPVQLIGKLGQGMQRFLRGRRGNAGKSWLAARGHWHFLRRELGRFWKA